MANRRPCVHVNQQEVRVIDPDWFGTDETVGWLRCRDCQQVLCEPKIVGDEPIRKEIWE